MSTDWSIRYCAKHGHQTYEPDEQDLAHLLSATLHDGRRVWKCLRCGTYVEHAAHSKGAADDAPHVIRDKEVKDRFILRLL
ncbi:MAG: hypothetical protein J2O48_13580, partial [Solirubrobacterales bacterium]|nr:hypothetical protein [Solirubrobacterales bacterium]